jgi:hypothetical protein
VALVHRVRVAGRIAQEPRMQGAHAVALVVERSRRAVGARGDQGAVLGIEQEDEAQQDREQALVEVRWPLGCQALDPCCVGSIQPAQQLVQGAQHLGREA